MNNDEPKRHARFVGARKAPERRTLVGLDAPQLDPEAVSHLAQRAAVEAEFTKEDLAELTRDVAAIRGAVETIRGHVADQGGRLAEIEGAFLREVVPSFQAIKTALECVVALQRAVEEIDKRLGHPPQKLAERASQTGEQNVAELVRIETEGTGVAGVVGILTARIARLEMRVAGLAVAGVTIVQVATSLMQSGHEAFVGAGAGVLCAVALVAYLVRRRKAAIQ